MTDLTKKSKKIKFTTLKEKKHEQIDFFIADEFEILTLRDEIASMEHPFFALKGGDKKIRNYKNGDNYLIVKPSYDGLATIFDKDIWIYAISKLQQAMNDKKILDVNLVGRTLFFRPYDFFVVANRDKGGRSYKELQRALGRLSGTRVQTNIKNGNRKEIEEFGLIDRWKIVEENSNDIEVGMIEIVLPDWLFSALENNKILKINSDYFRIRKAIDRRIYELARKHCGYQYQSEISIEKLYIKTGSTALLKMFRHNIKQLAKENKLPDYEVIFDSERDVVIFKNRNPNTAKANKMESIKKGNNVLKQIKKQIKCSQKIDLKIEKDK